MSDNRVFNVNGSSLERLVATLELAMQSGHAKGWSFSKDHGFILFDYGECENKFPAELSAQAVAPMAFAWLKSPDALSMTCSGWDADCDHDGDNSPGWRVYVEDWGHVAGKWGVHCAIRPAFMWHGK